MQVKNNLFEEDSEVALWNPKSKTTEYMLPLNSYQQRPCGDCQDQPSSIGHLGGSDVVTDAHPSGAVQGEIQESSFEEHTLPHRGVPNGRREPQLDNA